MIIYLLVNTSTAIITWAGYNRPTPANGQVVIQTADTITNAVLCLQAPTTFTWNGTAIVPIPQWSLTYTGTRLTATIIGASPSIATLTIANATVQGTPVNGSVTWLIQLHPSVANQLVWAEVTAPNTVAMGMSLGGDATDVGLQYIPSSITGLIAPAGPGSAAYLREFYFAETSPDGEVAVLITSLQSLYMSTAIVMGILMTTILPWMQAQVNPPQLSPTAQTAINILTTQVLPNVVSIENGILNADGSLNPAFIEMIQQAGPVTDAFQNYVTALETLPNLQ